MHVLVDTLKNVGKVVNFVVDLILLAVLLQVFANESEVIPGHAGETMVLIMELQATVVPVQVGVTPNVRVCVYHVCGEVHLLLVGNVVERLPVMIRDEL